MKKNICVFCGSRPGNNPDWSNWTYELGVHIAQNNLGLVFGGGGRGLMGQVASGALSANGSVIGIIPHQLEMQEGLVEHLSEIHYVQTMSARKQLMDEFANAYVIIPGGVGTLDEFFEVWATAQTGFHEKLIILANWSGYYDGLINFLKHSVAQGMMSTSHFEKINIVSNLEEVKVLLQQLNA